MVVAWISGLGLLTALDFLFRDGCMRSCFMVVALSGVHGFLSAEVRRFGEDQRTRDQKFYRIVNEVPTLLMIGIVIFVILKPFS